MSYDSYEAMPTTWYRAYDAETLWSGPEHDNAADARADARRYNLGCPSGGAIVVTAHPDSPDRVTDADTGTDYWPPAGRSTDCVRWTS